jgi:hypothetical protein
MDVRATACKVKRHCEADDNVTGAGYSAMSRCAGMLKPPQADGPGIPANLDKGCAGRDGVAVDGCVPMSMSNVVSKRAKSRHPAPRAGL